MADSAFTLAAGDGLTRGVDPSGANRPISVGGSVFQWDTPLAANGVKSTDWIDHRRYGSLLYAVRSDQPSAAAGITLEYSYDGTTAVPAGQPTAYASNDVNGLLRSGLAPIANYFRITYANGSTAQTNFLFEVRVNTTLIQPSLVSLNRGLTKTLLAQTTLSAIELDDGTGVFAPVNRVGNAQMVIDARATGATHTNVAAATTSTQVLAANPNRKFATIWNNGTSIMYVKYGAGASATSCVFGVAGGQLFVLDKEYTGIVHCVWSAVNGAARVTEGS